MSTSPTQRTLKYLRQLGYLAEVVERFNSFTKQRHDLIGCVDILALSPESGFMGVQTCAGASHAARADKMRAEPRAAQWLAAGGKLAVYSWSKRGAAGKRKVWTLRTQVIESGDIVETVPASTPALEVGADAT